MAAARKTARKPPVEALPGATVATREYASGVGWNLGDLAPTDAYRRLDSTGRTAGPVLYAHPGGACVKVAIGGQRVTDSVRAELDRADAEQADA